MQSLKIVIKYQMKLRGDFYSLLVPDQYHFIGVNRGGPQILIYPRYWHLFRQLVPILKYWFH